MSQLRKTLNKKTSRFIIKNGYAKDILGNEIDVKDICIMLDSGVLRIAICNHYTNNSVVFKNNFDDKIIKGMELKTYKFNRIINFESISELVLNLTKFEKLTLIKERKNE